MARNANTTLIAVALLAACTLAQAQSLGDPAPINRVMDVAQFGMPRDAKLIFCDGQDCPDRTVKTLTSPTPVMAPPPPRPPPVPVVTPQPQSMQPPAELSPAKETPLKKHKKKAAPKKRAPRIDCGPETKK